MHPSLGPATIDTALLGILLEAAQPTTPAALAARLQTDTQAVEQKLHALQAAGCQFQRHPVTGITLEDAGLGVWCDYLQAFAPTLSGQPRLIEVYKRTSSTQDAVARMLDSFADQADACVAVADYQNAGRGRLGRAWIAPEGTCLTFSTAILSTPDQPLTSDRLMLAAAVAVAHALEDIPGIPAQGIRIKWPNDILIHGKKLAGILVEQTTRPHWRFTASIIGIGINTGLTNQHTAGLPPELAQRLTSLRSVGVNAHRLPLLGDILTRLERYTRAAEPQWLQLQWRSRSGQLGTHVNLITNGQLTSGTVLDIDPQLGLIIQSDQGPILHLPAATTSVAT